MANFRTKLTVCVAAASPILSTPTLFDSSYRESDVSPIDEFLTRLRDVNKLAPTPSAFDPFQGQLVLLGAIAAVESFIRTLFRKVIVLDPTSQRKVQDRDVSYGAATHLSRELLPEALLERISFISKQNITDALRQLLAVQGNIPSDLDSSIDEYVRVCQLRQTESD